MGKEQTLGLPLALAYVALPLAFFFFFFLTLVVNNSKGVLDCSSVTSRVMSLKEVRRMIIEPRD